MCLDEAVQSTIVAHVRDHIVDVRLAESYRAVLVSALAQRGNVLSPAPDFRWALPVLACCIAAGGIGFQAVPPAAGMEVAMVAYDLLDDVEDGDATPLIDEYGLPAALNVSTGLLLLAQDILLEAAIDRGLLRIWHDVGLRSCSGQHQDLTLSSTMDLSYDDALSITASKSGALMAGACQMGAACAGADASRQAMFAHFGLLAGVVAQLANDIRAIESRGPEKTDALLHRPTLPLVCAERAHRVAGTEANMPSLAQRTGACHFTWAVAETYRRQAQRLIPSLTTDPASRENLATLLQRI